jgi:hypothetical protein
MKFRVYFSPAFSVCGIAIFFISNVIFLLLLFRTSKWHEIIEAFKASVPLKRHWRNFRAYPDCFAANEAVEWLYRYLKTSSNFKAKTKIQRQQAVQLLQVFLNENIFEDVRGDKYSSKQFQDDDRLYKCV